MDDLDGPFDFEYDYDDDDDYLLGNRLRGQKYKLGSSLNPSGRCPPSPTGNPGLVRWL